jgi:hypothetical protein
VAKLGGEVKQVFRSKVDAARTRAAIADLDKITAATTEATSAQKIGADTLKFVLQEQNHGVARFTGQYTVRYSTEGDEVVWRTLEGNMVNEGRARVVARADGGADVHWTQRIETEVPVPGLLARALAPVATKIMEGSIQGYVARLLASA